ncbi:MAG: hypothetical protein NDI69_09015 [Bacteriovoracaceae bacterium]|nr:hypothetical protein [Bacteriovoracaceae bacterium]
MSCADTEKKIIPFKVNKDEKHSLLYPESSTRQKNCYGEISLGYAEVSGVVPGSGQEE